MQDSHFILFTNLTPFTAISRTLVARHFDEIICKYYFQGSPASQKALERSKATTLTAVSTFHSGFVQSSLLVITPSMPDLPAAFGLRCRSSGKSVKTTPSYIPWRVSVFTYLLSQLPMEVGTESGSPWPDCEANTYDIA
jgi:hypothetical protein